MAEDTAIVTIKANKQEFNYRKQVERQLRTQYVQYVEGIYDNPVTLKSRLTVTQGHWKRNHWVDHTRLTIKGKKGKGKFIYIARFL